MLVRVYSTPLFLFASTLCLAGVVDDSRLFLHALLHNFAVCVANVPSVQEAGAANHNCNDRYTSVMLSLTQISSVGQQ